MSENDPVPFEKTAVDSWSIKVWHEICRSCRNPTAKSAPPVAVVVQALVSAPSPRAAFRALRHMESHIVTPTRPPPPEETPMTVNVMDMTLARWGDGSFTLTGWGWLFGLILLGSFGTFIRDITRRHK